MSKYSVNYFGGCGPEIEGFYDTLRQFWQESYEGTFASSFEAGVQGGFADLENGDTAYFDTLDAVEKSARDLTWQASIDGYRVTVKKERGPTKYG